MKIFFLVIFSFVLVLELSSKTIKVGISGEFARLSGAAEVALPADTILIMDDFSERLEYIEDLHGEENNWIVIRSGKAENAVYDGGSQAIHFVNASYLKIENLTFMNQVINGVNIDDGGDYSTPSHHIVFENCEWRDMQNSGNNDLLKMSGVDDFNIINCHFENGSQRGSMIDMVGCHDGVIESSHFINGGSNSIQAKGGSENIIIRRNYFENGGYRAINIGGSTGEPYFRPLDANFESARISVHSNIFAGSQAPLAFVGTVESKVFNNTIFEPEKWVFRILQENTNPGILTCSNNQFFNNIVYIDNMAASPSVNIGPKTDPESFFFGNNLWYNYENENWHGPNLPSQEENAILNHDPLFADVLNNNYELQSESPAIGKGKRLNHLVLDYNEIPFSDPPSIGAYEWIDPSGIFEEDITVILYPNPGSKVIYLQMPKLAEKIEITDIFGITRKVVSSATRSVNVEELPPGIYFLNITLNGQTIIRKFMKVE